MERMKIGGVMSRERTPAFELPRKLEKVLASLATYYGQHDKPVLQRLLVNSRYHVHEEWSYDNWDGGTYGHAIYFQVPAAIYYEIFNSLDSVSKEICERINRISNVQNEFVEQIFFEVQDDPSLENWREKSGVLIHTSAAAMETSEEQLIKLWKPGYLRLFISHKAEYKMQTSQLKEAMDWYGVSCFVAHEDIEPTKEWRNEIEKALFSMDALLALMTEDFSDSCWTDQEIGVAIGRQVPIVPVRLGIDPYGFIGKYQPLAGDGKKADALAKEVYELLWTKPSIRGRLIDSLVTRFAGAVNFDHANYLMKYVTTIENVPPEIIERLEKAPKENSQVEGAFTVRRELPGVLKKLRGGHRVISQ